MPQAFGYRRSSDVSEIVSGIAGAANPDSEGATASPPGLFDWTTVVNGNVISGNNRSGVLLQGAGTTGNRVLGNYIGLYENGGGGRGNSWTSWQDGSRVPRARVSRR